MCIICRVVGMQYPTYSTLACRYVGGKEDTTKNPDTAFSVGSAHASGKSRRTTGSGEPFLEATERSVCRQACFLPASATSPERALFQLLPFAVNQWISVLGVQNPIKMNERTNGSVWCCRESICNTKHQLVRRWKLVHGPWEVAGTRIDSR